MNNEIPCQLQKFDTFIQLAAGEKSLIRAAQNVIQKSTCIKFERIFDPKTAKDYVHIKPGSGCASTIGYLGGEQIIYLQRNVKTFLLTFSNQPVKTIF
jgi:Astacin (Peptidase family M12A)